MLGHCPTLFSQTMVGRNITLFLPKRAVYSSEQRDWCSSKPELSRAMTGEETTLYVDDGGLELITHLVNLRFTAYMVYHPVPFVNGGYEIIYQMSRSVVEVDNANRIVVHPPLVLDSHDKNAKAHAKINFYNEMKNARRFMKIFASKAFQQLFYDIELPAPMCG